MAAASESQSSEALIGFRGGQSRRVPTEALSG
jgi:hypothetical protein